jgi:transposase-like protein
MPQDQSHGKPTTRRYTPQEKADAVRMVRALRTELGTEHGTVQRVAKQSGYGVKSIRSWVPQAHIDDGHVAGGEHSEAARVKRWSRRSANLSGPTRSSSGPPVSSGRSSTANTRSSHLHRRQPLRRRRGTQARSRAHL